MGGSLSDAKSAPFCESGAILAPCFPKLVESAEKELHQMRWRKAHRASKKNVASYAMRSSHSGMLHLYSPDEIVEDCARWSQWLTWECNLLSPYVALKVRLFYASEHFTVLER